VGKAHRVQLHNPWDSHNQSINQFTFLVFKTHQGRQQTITRRILRMSSLNDTSHQCCSRRDRSWAQKVQICDVWYGHNQDHMCTFGTTTHMYHMSPRYWTSAECFMTAPTQHGCRPLQLAGHCNGSVQSK